ncbi:hypothetical protein DFJ74DRAFT_715457 [Hyaloraphidium curvatum]|nr:hypothetical protein DFJ74DRAFT_715457 [Hyaloraphidium curvatum]
MWSTVADAARGLYELASARFNSWRRGSADEQADGEKRQGYGNGNPATQRPREPLTAATVDHGAQPAVPAGIVLNGNRLLEPRKGTFDSALHNLDPTGRIATERWKMGQTAAKENFGALLSGIDSRADALYNKATVKHRSFHIIVDTWEEALLVSAAARECGSFIQCSPDLREEASVLAIKVSVEGYAPKTTKAAMVNALLNAMDGPTPVPISFRDISDADINQLAPGSAMVIVKISYHDAVQHFKPAIDAMVQSFDLRRAFDRPDETAWRASAGSPSIPLPCCGNANVVRAWIVDDPAGVLDGEPATPVPRLPPEVVASLMRFLGSSSSANASPAASTCAGGEYDTFKKLQSFALMLGSARKCFGDDVMREKIVSVLIRVGTDIEAMWLLPFAFALVSSLPNLREFAMRPTNGRTDIPYEIMHLVLNFPPNVSHLGLEIRSQAIPDQLVKLARRSEALTSVALTVTRPNVIFAFASQIPAKLTSLVSSALPGYPFLANGPHPIRVQIIHEEWAFMCARDPSKPATLASLPNLETLGFGIENYLDLQNHLAYDCLLPRRLKHLKLFPVGDTKPPPAEHVHDMMRDRLARLETVEVCMMFRALLSPHEVQFWESLPNKRLIEGQVPKGFPFPLDRYRPE